MSTATGSRLASLKQHLRGGVGSGGNPFASLQAARPEPVIHMEDDTDGVDEIVALERTATEIAEPFGPSPAMPVAVVPPTVETAAPSQPQNRVRRFYDGVFGGAASRLSAAQAFLYTHRKSIVQYTLITAVLAVVSLGYYLGIVNLTAIAVGWFGVVFAGRLVQQAVTRSAFLAYDATGKFRPSRTIVFKSVIVVGMTALLMATTGEVWHGLVTGALAWLYADRLLERYLVETVRHANHRLEGWQRAVA